MKQTHIIAVLNQKGGVGKTTTTINLAAYLSKSNRRVLIVDADPQANATSGLGYVMQHGQLSLGEVLNNSSLAAQAIAKTNIVDVDILPATHALASVELDLHNAESRQAHLQQSLQMLAYDYILIDCPPALGLLTINALTAADLVLIPVQAEYYALEGLSQLLQVMQQVKRAYNPDLELLGVVMTMYDKRTSLAAQVYNEVRQHFDDKLFKSVIPRNVRLAEAPSHGLSIMEYDKWSKGARAYKNLAKEVDQRVKHT